MSKPAIKAHNIPTCIECYSEIRKGPMYRIKYTEKICSKCINKNTMCGLCNKTYNKYTKQNYSYKPTYELTNHIDYDCPKDKVECQTCFCEVTRDFQKFCCQPNKTVTVEMFQNMTNALIERDGKIKELTDKVDHLNELVYELKYWIDKFQAKEEHEDDP